MAELRTRYLLTGWILSLLSGCASSLHGSFATTSYAGDVDPVDAEVLGPVEGRSCQTQFLYLLSVGEPATTHAAVEDAKSVHEGTRFIADVSIDDETFWGFGYSEQCIVVRATAYR